jgi:eukaryotic-like serine/threonine-protein kinase
MPSAESGCLSPDVLLDWAEQRVTPEEIERIESHVADCSTCRRLLAEAVSGTDSTMAREPKPFSTIGRYELRGTIGRGGMGEVHRAFDPSLNREVALKILRETGSDPDSRRRFEREARAAALVSHPNVVAIFDFGVDGDLPYLVTELLEGESVEQRLARGRMALTEAIDISIQVARGLVAAHDKAVIHRDLKPANLFLTKSGVCKILDFGLAKSVRPRGSEAETHSDLTSPGAVIGTLSYMAPEQARGDAADHRSDIFALGVIIFELLTGKRAFKKKSSLETLHAILTEEPFAQEALPAIPLPLERIVRRALAKESNDRFQSARDLLFALETTANLSTADLTKLLPIRATPKKRRPWIAAGLAALVGGGAIALLPRSEPTLPSYQRVVFRAGTLYGARFAPQGEEIIVSAVFDRGMELVAARTGSPELRSLDHRAGLFAVSRSGQLAIGLDPKPWGSWFTGTAALVPMAGGAPRSVAEKTQSADFDPEGTVAISRIDLLRSTVEYPPGEVIFDQPGWISELRFSSKGDLAFIHHPYNLADTGQIMRLDRGGELRPVGPLWDEIRGLAWSDDEIWFTATQDRFDNELHALSSSGEVRKLLTAPGRLVLHDIGRDGSVLLSREELDSRTLVGGPAIEEEIDVSWLDDAIPLDMTPDGRTVITVEWGEAVGDTFALYQRSIDGSPAIRLGDGRFARISPDGREVITVPPKPPFLPIRMPLGAGLPKPLNVAPLESVMALEWCPDGACVFLLGNEPNAPLSLYKKTLDDGALESLGECPLTFLGFELSPDGTTIFSTDQTSHIVLWNIADRSSRVLADAEDLYPIGWSTDGRAVHLLRRGSDRSTIERLDLSSEESTVLHTLRPIRGPGFYGADIARMTPDEKTYVYLSRGWSSRLYVVRGLK